MAEVHKQQASTDGLEPEFIRILIIVVLVTMGVMLFLFSLALMKDLQTLQRAPELVWAFICGVPSEDGPALPLLLTLSTLSILGAILVTIWHIWKRKTTSLLQDS